jgi:hypothetical protein
LSGYQVVTTASNVNLLPFAVQSIVVNCPSGASVLHGFLYRVSGGERQPLPSGVNWTGWPSARGQWAFAVRNGTTGGYGDLVETGVVCAIAN